MEKTTTDAQGVEHRIRVRPVPFDEGFELGLIFAEMLGAPGAEALGGLFGRGSLAESVRTLPRILREHGGPKLVRRLCAYVERETLDEATGEPVWQKLSNALAFDQAFRGNYLEALDVVEAVLVQEFAPVFRGLSARWGMPFRALASRVIEAVEGSLTQSESGETTVDE